VGFALHNVCEDERESQYFGLESGEEMEEEEEEIRVDLGSDPAKRMRIG
jgi:hypothetical protein